MSSLQHAAIAGKITQTFEVKGCKYTLKPVLVGVYAEMEAYLLSLREDPVLTASKLISKIPPAQQAAFWEAAFRASSTQARVVTAEEVATFEKSVRGRAFQLWCCLRENHPEINCVDAALNLMELAGEAQFHEICHKLDVVSTTNELGN